MGIALREIFARFGVSFDTKGLVDGFHATEELTDRVKDLAKSLTAPALVTGAVAFARHVAGVGQAMADQARGMNMSATSMREWQFVAEASGLQVEEMNSALYTLSQNARAATEGDYDMAYSFRRLGVSIRDGNYQLKSTGVLLDEVTQRLAQVERPRLRAQLGFRLLGESARYIVPLFEDGGRSVHSMQEEVRALVGGDIEEFTAQSTHARQEGARSRLAFEAMSNSLALVLMPTITRATSYVSAAVAWFKKWTDKSYVLQSAIQVMSVVIAASLLKAGISAAVAFAPALLAIAPYALALGALILIVDDLNALFSGGKSILGEWIDEMFHVGASAEAVRFLKDVWQEIIEIVSRAIGVVSDFLGLTGQQAQGTLNPGAAREYFRRQDQQRLAARGMTEGDTMFDPARRMTPDERRMRNAPISQLAGAAATDFRNQFASMLQFARNPRGRVTPEGASVGSGGRAGVRVATSVGQIVVNPSAGMNEAALADLVHDRIQSRQSNDLRAARRALVTRVPGFIEPLEQ